jgi:hypothetical protein
LTCIDSIYGFGLQSDNSGSGVGNNSGYLAASATAVSAVSANAYTSGNYTINGSSSYGNNASATSTNNTTYGVNGTGMDIFTNAGYLGSGGAYASGNGTFPLPLGWVYTGISSKCKIAELVYNITQIREATDTGALSWSDIVEFYFSVYHKHYDDAASFIGYHNHSFNSNQILHWSGSSIKDGSMRGVPNVAHISVPNTYDANDAATQILVIHLGFAPEGHIGMHLTGVRLRS